MKKISNIFSTHFQQFCSECFPFLFVWSVDEIKRQQNVKSSTLYSKYSRSVDWKKIHLTFNKFFFVLRGGKMNSAYVREKKKTLKTSRRRVTWEWDASNLCRRSWASGWEKSESQMGRYESRMSRHMSHEWKDKLWFTMTRCVMSHEWDAWNLCRRSWASGWERGESRMYESRMRRHTMSHEWEDAIWVTNEMFRIVLVDHEHLVEREASHEWVTNEGENNESRVTNEKTYDESRMRKHTMASRMRRHNMSHKWGKKLESWMRRHMSHEWKDISWVTNEWPAKVCCTVLQCVAVCCSVLQRVAVCGSVLQCVAVCCSDMMEHERVTCSGVMPKSTTSPCAYSRYITRHMKWVTNERGHMSHEWEDTGWVTNYTIHHHTDDVLWVTNEEAYHESRIRGHMSHDWEETWWVTNEETYHESQIRGHMSHEWEETWWVTNEETYHESRIRGHMSHEWEETWWVTNEETYHESRIRGHMSHEWEDT